MTETMDLTLSVDEQRTKELLKQRRLNPKITDKTDEQYENEFRTQGMTKLR